MFSSSGAWTGGFPQDNLTDSIGQFKQATIFNQPVLTASRSIGGLRFTNTATAYTLSNTGGATLSIGGFGIDNQDLDSTQTISAALRLGAAASFINAGTLAISGSVNLNGFGLTLDGAGAGGSMTGVISGNGSITKTGTGTWTLDAANNFPAFNITTTISQGTLELKSGTYGSIAGAGGTLEKTGAGTVALNQSGTFSGTTNVAAGTLEIREGFALKNSTVALNGGNIIFNGSLAFQTVFGSLSGSGNLTAVNALGGGQVELSVGSNNASTSYSGGLTTLGGNFTKTGTGTLALTGTNTFAGGVRVEGGTLALGSAGAVGGTATIQLAGGTLQYSAANTADLSSRIGYSFGGIKIDTNGQDVTFASALDSTNTGGLTKLGGGALTLTGANTYTGNTQIDAGTVRINNTSGSAFGTGTVTVASGATLAGAGSFSGALQLNGTLSAGNSPGTLSTGSETWAGGAGLIWEINDVLGTAGGNPGWDLLSISGLLDIDAAINNPFTIHLNSLTLGNVAGQALNFDAASDYSFTLVHTTLGIVDFNAADFAFDFSGFQNTFDGTWSIGQSGNDLVLHYDALDAGPANPAPDWFPHATLFACLGLIAAHWQRSRRAASA